MESEIFANTKHRSINNITCTAAYAIDLGVTSVSDSVVATSRRRDRDFLEGGGKFSASKMSPRAELGDRKICM